MCPVSLSIIFWTLILVISLKYMVYVLRADNRGEGGTFALLALLALLGRTGNLCVARRVGRCICCASVYSSDTDLIFSHCL